jgi:hypothetical protein
MRISQEEFEKTLAEKDGYERTKTIAREYRKRGSAPAAAKALGTSADCIARHLNRVKLWFDITSIRDLLDFEEEGDFPSSQQLLRLLEKQGHRCALSGVKLTPETAELDHIVPLAKGGSNAISNVQWLHKRINRMKGSMKQDDFIDMCSKVSQWRN